jgi:hypothetical protein
MLNLITKFEKSILGCYKYANTRAQGDTLDGWHI